jgi:hypothetical protein
MFRTLLIVVGVPLLLVGLLFIRIATQPEGTSRFPADGERVSGVTPDGVITLAKSTTHITSPLRSDGYVDYIAALNQISRQDFSPQHNAAARFWQVLGPGPILGAGKRAKYFELLGIPTPSDKGDYFVMPEDHVRNTIGENQTKRTEHLIREIWDEYEAANVPWKRESLPALAAWLRVNEEPLQRLVECTRCKRFSSPLVDTGCISPMMGSLILGDAEFRLVGRLLRARAMLHVGEGRIQQAWDDLQACHRLGRLIGQSPVITLALRGCDVDAQACRGDTILAMRGGLTAEQASQFCQDLAQLPPLPDFVEKVNTGERFFYLDAAAAMARRGPGALGPSEDDALLNRFNVSLYRRICNWDEVLRTGNDYYDRVVDAARKPTRAERLLAIREVDDELEAMEKESGATTGRRIAAGDSRMEIAHVTAARLLTLFATAMGAVLDAQDRYLAYERLAHLSLALAAYRADPANHRRNPERLSMLTPQYVPCLPPDPFSDGDFWYVPKQDGYLLYSVGPNGRDDHGCNDDGTNGADDISASLPDENQRLCRPESMSGERSARIEP